MKQGANPGKRKKPPGETPAAQSRAPFAGRPQESSCHEKSIAAVAKKSFCFLRVFCDGV
jgi:hypothetical protein